MNHFHLPLTKQSIKHYRYIHLKIKLIGIPSKKDIISPRMWFVFYINFWQSRLRVCVWITTASRVVASSMLFSFSHGALNWRTDNPFSGTTASSLALLTVDTRWQRSIWDIMLQLVFQTYRTRYCHILKYCRHGGPYHFMLGSYCAAILNKVYSHNYSRNEIHDMMLYYIC